MSDATTRDATTRDHQPISRRRFLRLATAATAATAATLLAAGGVAQAYGEAVVESIELRLAGLTRTTRIAFLADLHVGPFVRRGSLTRWFDAALATRPDLIALGGDIVDQRAPRDLGPLFEEIERLVGSARADAGRGGVGSDRDDAVGAPLVVAVLGNHEYRRFRQPRPFLNDLRALGVTTLVNEGTLLDGGLYLAGADDHRHGRPDLRATLAARPAGAPTVLLSHNPDLLPMVPTDVDLTLCGHTHGGQVRLPGIGPVVTSSTYGRRFAAGMVRGPALGYVSRGLGVGYLPIRWDCPPEVTVVTLRAA